VKDLYEWPTNLDRDQRNAEETHQLERKKLEDKLKMSHDDFKNRIEVYYDEIKQFENYTEYTNYENYITEIVEYEKKVENAAIEMRDLLDKQMKIIGYQSNFELFGKMKENLDKYSLLWKSIGAFSEAKNKILTSPVQNLDPIQVIKLFLCFCFGETLPHVVS